MRSVARRLGAPRWFYVVFACLTVGISASAYAYYRSQRAATLDDAFQTLDVIARLRSEQVRSWLRWCAADVVALAGKQAVIGAVGPPARCGPSLEEAVVAWIGGSVARAGYRHVYVVNKAGDTVYRYPWASRDLRPHELIVAQRAMRAGRTVKLGLESYDGRPDMAIATPIHDDPIGQRAVVGALVLRVDPASAFAHVVGTWPGVSRTGRILLVHRSNRDAVVLTNKRTDIVPLGSARTADANLRLLARAAEAAPAGRTTVAQAEGRRVLMTAAEVSQPDLHWRVVTHVDEEEVLQPLRAITLGTALVEIVMALGAFAIMLAAWREHALREVRALYEAERLQHEATRQLHESRAVLELIINAIPQRVFWKDLESRYLGCNVPFARDSGVETPADVIGKTDEDLSWRPEAVRYSQEDREIIDTGIGRIGYEDHDNLPDGTTRWLRATKVPLHDDDGRVAGVLGTYEDITDLRQIQEELREGRRRLATLMDNLPGMAYGCANDEQWTMEFCSDGCSGLTGYSSDELIGNRVVAYADLIHPDDRQAVWNSVQEGVEGSNPYRLEYRIIRRDGAVHWVFEVGRAILDDAGAIVALEGIILDDNNRHEAMDRLRRIEAAVQASGDAMLLTSPDGRHMYSNAACDELLGYGEDRYPSRPEALFADAGLGREVLNRIRSGEEWRGQAALVASDRRSITFALTANAVRDEQGNVVGLVLVGRDVTAELRSAAALRAATTELARRNRELAQVLYVASHDLRSPLINIQGFGRELSSAVAEMGELARRDALDAEGRARLAALVAEDVPTCMRFIGEGVSRMEQLLNGLLVVSRLGRAPLSPARLDMTELVRRAAMTVEYEAHSRGATIEVETLPRCWGDAAQIGQVFTNLLSNAVKYLDPARPGHIKVTGVVEEESVRYCVEDNGVGIAPEHQERVFEMFHRLNPHATEGEGLGLTIVRTIVDRHSGSLQLESVPGVGSRFTVVLPLQEPAPLRKPDGEAR